MKDNALLEKRYTLTLQFLLLFSLFIMPFIQLPPAYNYVLIKLSQAQFFILVSLLYLFSIWEIKGEGEIPLNSALKSAGFLSLWLLLGTIFSPYPFISIKYIQAYFTYLLFFFLLILGFKNFARPYVLSGVLLLPYYLLIIKETIYYYRVRDLDIASTFGNPNFFAGYLCALFPLSILFSLHLLVEKKKFYGLIPFSLSFLSLFLIYVVRSRAGGIGVLGGLFVLFLIYRRLFFKGKRKWLTWGSIGVIFFLGIYLLATHYPQIKNTLKEDLEKGTLGIRVKIWQGTWRMIKKRPIGGWGPGTFLIIYPNYRLPEYFLNPHAVNATDHAHNELLEIWSETGIIGLVTFLLLVFFSFKEGLKKDNSLPKFLTSGLIGGATALLVNNLFGVNLRYASSSILFFTFLAFLQVGNKKVKERKFPVSIPHGQFTFYLTLFALAGGFWFFSAGVKPNIAQIHLRQAIELRNREVWNEAIKEYLKALVWDPYELRCRYRLAYAYAVTGNVNEALKEYLHLKKLAPHYAELDFNLGALYLKKGELDRAKLYLEEMLRLNPYHPTAHANLGLVLKLQGKIDEAIKEFKRALELDPKIYPAYWDLAGLLRLKKKYAEALKYLKKLKDLKGGDEKLNEVIKYLERKVKRSE
ncbi:O-antigen ligase family protein [Candidatus Calescamantes bacterium]|nr:O-antigen ligase family protein [Candidatus Calescamantes bacterium]